MQHRENLVRVQTREVVTKIRSVLSGTGQARSASATPQSACTRRSPTVIPLPREDAMETTNPMSVVGSDIAARTLAVAIAHGDAPPASAITLTNDAAAWRELIAVLVAQGSAPATTLVVMEATGAYGQGLA